MSKMQEEYDHLLNLNYQEPYQIPLATSDTMLFCAGRPAEKLDGLWNFSVDVFDTLMRKKLFLEKDVDEQGRDIPVDRDFDRWEQVMVPSNWNIQKPQYYYYEGSGIYTRRFQYLAHQPDERVFLRLGAANYACRVWINGELLGRHEGGFTPFFVELTGKLNQRNRIVLMVNNRRELSQVPSINYDWFNYGGLPRSIELFRVPKLYIKDFFVSLKPDATFHTIRMRVQLNEALGGVVCELSIPELEIAQKLTTDENGVAYQEITASPQLWSCENPKLYKVIARAGADAVSDEVGFREIRVEGKEVLLNASAIFLKGVCCHEESVKNARALDDDERMHMLQTAKELGCNVMRLSHYPHSERMARLADRLGIMLWEEIPVYWALCFEDENTYQNAENQMRELILRDRNRASVIIWSVGNENPDTEDRLSFMSRLAQVCHSMDDTRPVSAACLVDVDQMRVNDRLCAAIDIVAFNQYYGWYYRSYDGLRQILDNTTIDKPIVISETGAGARPGHFGGDEELFTEEHQAKVYQHQFQNSDGKLQGIFPWILFDFRSPIRLHSMQDGQNRKGLIAFDKTYRKQAFQTVQDYYSNLTK